MGMFAKSADFESHRVERGDALSAATVERWLERIAPGKSFVDIGGLGADGGNERVTCAHRNGARRLALADFLAPEHPWWQNFDARCAETGVTNVEHVPSFDIVATGSELRLGSFDIVNSTGIMYHCPDMLGYLRKLRAVSIEVCYH